MSVRLPTGALRRAQSFDDPAPRVKLETRSKTGVGRPKPPPLLPRDLKQAEANFTFDDSALVDLATSLSRLATPSAQDGAQIPARPLARAPSPIPSRSASASSSVSDSDDADAEESLAALETIDVRPPAPDDAIIDVEVVQDEDTSSEFDPPPPRFRPADPAAPHGGPSLDFRRAFLTGVAGFVSSTGFAVFSKDVAVAALSILLQQNGYDPTQPPWLCGVAAIAGLWNGLTHQLASRLTAGLLNYAFGLTRYSPVGANEAERQWHDFLSQSLPTIASYTLIHALRGYLTADLTGTWESAFAKLLASSIAGGVAGILVDLLYCQQRPEDFSPTRPGDTFVENLQRHARKLTSDMNGVKIGRDYVGRALGGSFGFAAGAAVAAIDILPGQRPTSPSEAALAAALNRFVFQSVFSLGGSHIGGGIGAGVDAWRAGRDPGPPDDVFVAPAEIASESPYSSSDDEAYLTPEED